MKNQQYKQDAIRHLWTQLVGEENYSRLKLDENGYSNWQCRKLMPSNYWDALSDKLKQGKSKMTNGYDLLYRPKSLKGIENNNGWNNIFSPADLPKIGRQYLFLDSGRQVQTWCESGMSFPKSYTHWREIVELQLPFY